MLHNELPALVPAVNLVVSIAMLVGAIVLTARRLHRSGRRSMYLLLDIALVVTCIVLTTGAAFQANWLPLDLWVAIGTGGRIAALVVVLVLASSQGD